MSAGASYGQSGPQTIASAPGQVTQGAFNQFQKNDPAFYQQLEQQIPGFVQSLTSAANQGLAGTTAQAANLYNQYAPGLNQTQQQLGASNLQANAGAIGNTLNSPASSSINQGFAQGQGQLNPAYASTLGNLQSLMQNQNPNALSGSENAQITRSLNQSNFSQGNQNVQNPLTNINNALTFGSGLQQKQANFANLAGSAANTANTLNGGQSSFGLATGQPSGTSSANTSTSPSNFLVNPNNTLGLGSQASGVGQGFLGNVSGLFGQANNALAGQQQSFNASTQAGCCFVFIMGREQIPHYVRQMRDIAYENNPWLHNGYYTIASILCRLMCIPLIYYLVKRYMVKPLTEHCGYLAQVEGCRPHFMYKSFWFSVWNFVGKHSTNKI